MTVRAQSRPPRGAIAVIAVGLFATVVAALLSTDKPLGATSLEWVEEASLPTPTPVPVPGGGQMRLSKASIRATEANAGDFTLFRTSGLLTIDADSAVGRSRLRCAIWVPEHTIVAKTPTTRASFPLSSTDLTSQPVRKNALLEYSSHSSELALVELGDAIGKSFANEPGVVVEWPLFRIGRQVWQWGLPGGRPAEPLRLPFASIWRTTATPGARISCTIETAAGSATIRTAN